MHDYALPETLRAVGRAGAGVNNIPLEKLSLLGVAVFNAPGANANAVKELAVTGMLLAAHNVCQAWSFVRELRGNDHSIHEQVEAGKKGFRGFELPGRTLGVIGLGAVGVKVANAAIDLGMRVVGYDPDVTVRRAWELSSQVEHAASIGVLLGRADFVSLHVPLVDKTRHLINEDRIAQMRNGATLLNFARDGIVDHTAVVPALDGGKLNAYVCDFPDALIKDHPRVMALPHIGASTVEAEDNCAVMVADQIRAYLEDGNVRNSVNFPDVDMPRAGGFRVALVNANVPNMIGQISTTFARSGLNIVDLLNKSRGELAYTLLDVDREVPDAVISELTTIEGVMGVRAL
jgi:D-3-phosphoglycerate dehydrogenase